VKADRIRDLRDGHVSALQPLTGRDYAVAQQIFAKREAKDMVEAAAELKAAETAMLGDIARRELLVEVIPHIIGSFDHSRVQCREVVEASRDLVDGRQMDRRRQTTLLP
jgi:hypothetical protein